MRNLTYILYAGHMRFFMLTPFEVLLNSPSIQKRLLFKIYAMLMSKDVINNKIKHQWEIDIMKSISEIDWNYVVYWSQLFSQNVAIKEHSYKLLCRSYLILQCLSKMFLGWGIIVAGVARRSIIVSYMVELHFHCSLLEIYILWKSKNILM